MKPGGIKFESDAVVFQKTRSLTKQLSALIGVFMYWGRPVKIDTALYPISTQRNLAVTSDDISMPLNPDFYNRPSNFLNATLSKINRGCLTWSLSPLQL